MTVEHGILLASGYISENPHSASACSKWIGKLSTYAILNSFVTLGLFNDYAFIDYKKSIFMFRMQNYF